MTVRLPDPDRVEAIVRDVAAGIIMPYFRALDTAGVREKTGPMDLVTKADEEAERALTRRLAELVPGSVVVGEEAVSADASLLDRLTTEAPVWIIDPVDGTINFANGHPAFAVIVAYAHGGRTLAGWIHDPVSGRTAVAARGDGVRLDGARIRFAPPPPLSGLVGALSTRFCDPETAQRLNRRRATLGPDATVGSAAQEYLRMLQGSSHFALYHRLMPWDHAAGALMTTEAGGRAALLDGTPYRPTLTRGTMLNAVDEASWIALRDHLYG